MYVVNKLAKLFLFNRHFSKQSESCFYDDTNRIFVNHGRPFVPINVKIKMLTISSCSILSFVLQSVLYVSRVCSTTDTVGTLIVISIRQCQRQTTLSSSLLLSCTKRKNRETNTSIYPQRYVFVVWIVYISRMEVKRNRNFFVIEFRQCRCFSSIIERKRISNPYRHVMVIYLQDTY